MAEPQDTGEWPRPPVASEVRGTGHPEHVVQFTGGAIHALAHDNAEGVLAALGSPVCRCQLLQDGWQRVHADPALLSHLINCETVPPAWGPPLPPLLQPPSLPVVPRRDVPPEVLGYAEQLGRRAEFAAIASGTAPEFRLALARHIAEEVIARWTDPTFAGRGDVEHAVRAVLANSGIPATTAPLPWIRITITEPDTASRVAPLGRGSLAIDLPVTWLVDVAAAGKVQAWWREVWAA